MRAFKFKSAAQADHIFDILLNNRLFCANWKTLNDPMEGVFAYSYRGDEETDGARNVASEVQIELAKLCACSLTSIYDSHLLWAHYANGFNGVAVEVDLPDDHPDISLVKYRGVFGQFNYDASSKIATISRALLQSKYQEWSYERELRILSDKEWFPLEKPIPRLIVGHRVHPALFDALQIICERQGINFTSIGVGDDGLDADYVEPFADRSTRRTT